MIHVHGAARDHKRGRWTLPAPDEQPTVRHYRQTRSAE